MNDSPLHDIRRPADNMASEQEAASLSCTGSCRSLAGGTGTEDGCSITAHLEVQLVAEAGAGPPQPLQCPPAHSSGSCPSCACQVPWAAQAEPHRCHCLTPASRPPQTCRWPAAGLPLATWRLAGEVVVWALQAAAGHPHLAKEVDLQGGVGRLAAAQERPATHQPLLSHYQL